MPLAMQDISAMMLQKTVEEFTRREQKMSILYNEENRTITIHTQNTTYQMRVDEFGFLQHTYYGGRVGEEDLSYLHLNYDRACSGNPDETFPSRRISFDTMPQEYPGYGVGDYRINTLAARNADGSYGADFRYVSHEITQGKYALKGLPSSYDNGGSAETLTVTVTDAVSGLTLRLLYGVFEETDVITRAVRIINRGSEVITLDRAFSASLDIPFGRWDLIHFPGKHALERQTEREKLTHLVHSVESRRGTSSHQENPFVIIADRRADEDHGACYGMMLVYSGGFKAQAEVDQFDSTRIAMGIQDDQFNWHLGPGEEFDTPEVIMTYTGEGFTRLSQNYHKFIRCNICRGKYQFARRPILLNSWEASYFDFTDETILGLADEAAALGIDMLVMDDGWFGKRNSDNAGLGDWYVNENKIKCGLQSLVEQVNAKGLKFGIWMEPEMVNEDSDLYRAHPDWALTMPGRKPVRGRNQLALDMGRQEVIDYLYDCISDTLKAGNIEYLKWDMNRSLSDVYSKALPPERQGEVMHRYVLGLYELMGRIAEDFPDVLIEGCSGGGARFDAGILCYSPQIWCSDDTDPIHRLNIQYGTSFGYPVSAVGAHVSASPNHQTGRTTPLHTRGVAAMPGTFGYELDPAKLSAEEKEEIRDQIRIFRKYYDLIQSGLYYRLTELREFPYEAWEFAAEDGSEALLNVVVTDTQPNQTLINIRLKGLDPEATYELTDESEQYLVHVGPFTPEGKGRTYIAGDALMNAGYTFPWVSGDYAAMQIHFRKVK